MPSTAKVQSTALSDDNSPEARRAAAQAANPDATVTIEDMGGGTVIIRINH